MKKIITGMALLLVTTLSAFSQTKNITVSGRVVEDTKEPAIQATVQLLLLPDSVQASGTATTAQGYFTLPKVSAGKYVLKVSYIGFKSQYIPLHLYATTTAKNVGTLTLETDAVMLAEAVVTAEAPQVQVVEDTLVYTSSAYRTPEGAMLEELVKKLPGAEIDDEGNVKINGKWLGDTPGINAHAVGVNGKRAAIIDMRETDPEGWEEDQRPPLASPADVIIYEVHHRDFSVDPSSGIKNKVSSLP